MKIDAVLQVTIIPRHYIDNKTGLECFGHFVIIQFVSNNKVNCACSAYPGMAANTLATQNYEKAAFLKRAESW